MSRSIAWIEDDIDTMYAVIRPLIKAGFDIKEFYNYQEAIDRIGEIKNCDLILLDLILPPGNMPMAEKEIEGDNYLGKTLLLRLRNEFNVTVPIIVFSVVAHANNIFKEDELTCLNAHPVAKPIRPSHLKDEVLKLLGLFIED